MPNLLACLWVELLDFIKWVGKISLTVSITSPWIKVPDWIKRRSKLDTNLSLSASSLWMQCVQLCLCCYAFLVGCVGLHSPTMSTVKPFFLRSLLLGTLSQPCQEWLVHWAIITHRFLMNTLGAVFIFILYFLRKTLPTNTYRWIFHCLKPFHIFFFQ